MSQSALAYQLPARNGQQAAQPQLRAIPGKGQGVASAPSIASWAKTAVIMGAVLVAVLATVCVVKISVSNLTVQLLLQSEQINLAISDARAVGAELEVAHSLAVNPNKVQSAATAMGVVPSNNAITIEARHGFSADIQYMMAAYAMPAIKANTNEATNEATNDDISDEATAVSADANATTNASAANTNTSTNAE